MENLEIEHAMLKRQPEFFRKIKDAEKRGLKIKPGTIITPRMLTEFEKTGKITESSTRKASKLSFTYEDYQHYEANARKAIADKKELDAFRKDRELNRPLKKSGLAYISKPIGQTTTIFR